jgi:uncharacterized protein (UPF0147 family)
MNDEAFRDDPRIGHVDLAALDEIPPWQWPADARQVILGVLRNREADSSERLLAVELAGDMMAINNEVADVLLSILQDMKEPDELRAEAATSLGPVIESADDEEFWDAEEMAIDIETFRRIMKTLHEVYADDRVPAEIRRSALEASARFPQDWHADAVRTAYESRDEDWRTTAVLCMGCIGGFDDQILESLESPNLQIRYHAISAAGNRGVDAAWPRISALLQSKRTDKPTLLVAIEAAPFIRPRESMELLGDLLRAADEDIASAASEAYAMAEASLEADEDEDDETFEDDEFDEEDDDELR